MQKKEGRIPIGVVHHRADTEKSEGNDHCFGQTMTVRAERSKPRLRHGKVYSSKNSRFAPGAFRRKKYSNFSITFGSFALPRRLQSVVPASFRREPSNGAGLDSRQKPAGMTGTGHDYMSLRFLRSYKVHFQAADIAAIKSCSLRGIEARTGRLALRYLGRTEFWMHMAETMAIASSTVNSSPCRRSVFESGGLRIEPSEKHPAAKAHYPTFARSFHFVVYAQKTGAPKACRRHPSE
jgi:hypothetical protein